MVPAGGQYGTALPAAVFEGSPELVTLLLEKEAGPNIQGVRFVIPKMCD
jgi:hypothetical protein